LGFGTQGGGVGAARFFCQLGYDVIVTDVKPKKDFVSSIAALRGCKNIQYIFGKHRVSDIQHADLIVKNPGVPETSPYIIKARSLGKTITNDGALFLEVVSRERLIGVTGTKGKTTTTLLIKHLLGKDAVAVGVPGVSFFDYFYERQEPRFVVAEFSSFDLEYAHASPAVAVVTSLFPDHLNRYKSFTEYARVKMNIMRYQKSSDSAFVWSSSSTKKYKPRVKSKISWVAGKSTYRAASWRVAPEALTIAARVAGFIGIPSATIKKRMASFDAPAGRLEIIAKKKGYIFINDTTATNPGSATHSLYMLRHAFKKNKHISIITGGEDKKFPAHDIRQYAHAIIKLKINSIIIPGSFSEKLKKSLTKYESAYSMSEAVRRSSVRKGIVTLVPGAASFNMFKNEFDRALQFKKEIQRQRL
jgi:UDP-N-acetylmuramoylalanine--D-glutamate ligase